MKLIRKIPFFSLLFFGLIILKSQATVSGKIVSASDGKPVKNVLVAVTPGEEEALTNEQGEFKITTSKKPPYTVTAESSRYEPAKITVNDSKTPVLIRLRQKN